MSGPRAQLRGVLPGHTLPLTDELLSSWIVRLAIQNGLKVHALCQLVWRGGAVWNRDIDNSAPPELMEAFSRATGQSVDAIRGLTMASYEGRVFERHNPNGYTSWVLPLGVYHRTRKRHGLQFCPDCLDEKIYFRKRWRLAFMVACDKHLTVLSDRCVCGASINFHRRDIGSGDFGSKRTDMLRCFRCDTDLRIARAPTVDLMLLASALQLQRACTDALECGFAEIAGAAIPAVLYFAGVHQVLRILFTWKEPKILHVALGYFQPLDIELGTGKVERVEAQNRVVLMALASQWMSGWPERFVSVCRQAGVRASDVYRDLPRLPYWLASVVEEHLRGGTYSPTLPEIRNAIAYLRKRDMAINKASVSRLLGGRDVFRKRDLSHLLREDAL
jgi:hypothetical protein